MPRTYRLSRLLQSEARAATFRRSRLVVNARDARQVLTATSSADRKGHSETEPSPLEAQCQAESARARVYDSLPGRGVYVVVVAAARVYLVNVLHGPDYPRPVWPP
jgi:hypothetical protein